MNPDQELILYAKIIAVVAMLNWLTGDRSFSEHLLEVRKESMWLRMRWMGLGSTASCFAIHSENDINLSLVALTGALILLLGTARRRVKLADGFQPTSTNYHQSNEPNKI